MDKLKLEDLPSWESIVERASEVSVYGLNPLEVFIHDNEPVLDEAADDFRQSLLDVINEQRAIAWKLASQPRSE